MNQEPLMDEQYIRDAHMAFQLENRINEYLKTLGFNPNAEVDIPSWCAEKARKLGTPLPSMDFQDFKTLLPDVPVSQSIRSKGISKSGRIKRKLKSKVRID